jgi:hypothetical protein
MRLIFMDTTLNFFLSEGITEQEINSLIEGGKLMQKIAAICTLSLPATCVHRVDGKMAWISLCRRRSLAQSL